MIDEIVAIYAIVEDLLKAIGHQKDVIYVGCKNGYIYALH